MFSERVNIQYSVDVEELPAEVKRLLSRANKHIESLLASAAPAVTGTADSDVMSVTMLQDIDQHRRRLAAADYILNDVMNIVSGYLEFKAKAMAPTVDAPEPPLPELEEELPPQELHANMLFKDLSGLQEKVDKLNKHPK
jgi:hypothetical protein